MVNQKRSRFGIFVRRVFDPFPTEEASQSQVTSACQLDNGVCSYPSAISKMDEIRPVDSKSPREVSEARSRSDRIRAIQRNLALSTCGWDSSTDALRLKSCSMLINSSDRLNDDIIWETNSEEDGAEQLEREFPYLYLILDDARMSAYRKAVDYIRSQKVISFVLEGCYINNDQISCFEPLFVMFATRNFILIFDWKRLTEENILPFLSPVLEDDSVHKIVSNFHGHADFLQRKHGISIRNYYDVVEAERKLEAKWKLESLLTYSIRSFRNRYRNFSTCFSTFPVEDFELKSLERWKVSDHPRSGIRYIRWPQFFDLLKKIVYMELIKKCQMAILLQKSTRNIEKSLLEYYIYEPEWMFSGFHLPNPKLPEGVKIADSDSDPE